MSHSESLAALDDRFGSDQRGFSLMEAVVATAIAVIAVLGLAHSFGMGRALIDRYEIGRVALGAAELRMERFASLPSASVPTGADSVAFAYNSQTLGTERWSIEWVDDPYDGTGVGDISGGPQDLKRVTVTIHWAQEGGGMNRVELQRMLPAL